MQFPIEVIPPGSRAAFEKIDQRMAVRLETLWNLGPPEFGEGGKQIPEGPWLVGDSPGGNGSRPPGEGSLAECSLIHPALIAPQLSVHRLIETLADGSVWVKGRAIVTRENDEGVLYDALLLKQFDEGAEV